jgi:hypothetical protein
MFKKIDIRSTLIAASIAAIFYSIMAGIYIYQARYTDSWLLYFGSIMFGIVMWVHTVRDNRKRGENESTVALIFASNMATVAGVVISCFICLLLLIILVPGYLGYGMADKTLTDEPVNIIKDKTDGLSFEVFMTATIVNYSVGAFVGLILPFYSKRNQTRDTREPTPLHQRGAK